LGINYVPLDPQGQEAGPPQFLACSGFVVLFHGSWFFLTAGHVLKEHLDGNVKEGRIRIMTSSLADYFGPDAKVFRPTAFDYEGTERFYIDNRELGLDLGVMYLRPYFQAHLAANGVVPIEEGNWLRQHEVSFDSFGLLGLPSEYVTSGRRAGDFGEEQLGTVQATLVSVEKLEEMPEGIEESNLPWFIGLIRAQEGLASVRGMSGGPIFGFQVGADQRLRYWVVALQSRWYPQRRIILGCPVPVFMGILEHEFQEFLKGQEQ
jgi:hypothetical protein